MTDDFPLLHSPLRIGPREARNRVVCGAHFTMYTEPNATYCEPGFYGERYGRYLEQFARGGAGVVIAGSSPSRAQMALRNGTIAQL